MRGHVWERAPDDPPPEGEKARCGVRARPGTGKSGPGRLETACRTCLRLAAGRPLNVRDSRGRVVELPASRTLDGGE